MRRFLVWAFVAMCTSAWARVATNVEFAYRTAMARPGETMELAFEIEEDSLSASSERSGLTWESSDEKVATVDYEESSQAILEGFLGYRWTRTATVTVPDDASGTCTITATCSNGKSATLTFKVAEKLPEVVVPHPIAKDVLNGNAIAGASEPWEQFVKDGLFEGRCAFFADNRASLSNSQHRTESGFGLKRTLTVGDVTYQFDGYGDNATAFDGMDCVLLSANKPVIEGLPIRSTSYFGRYHVLATASGPGHGNYADVEVVVHYADGTTTNGVFRVYDWHIEPDKQEEIKANLTAGVVASESFCRLDNYGSIKDTEVAKATNGNGTSTYSEYYLYSLSVETDPTKFVRSFDLKLTGKNGGSDLSRLYVGFFASAGTTGGWVLEPECALTHPVVTNRADVNRAATTLEASWAAVNKATNYAVEFSDEPDFSNLIFSGNVEGTQKTFENLKPRTTYYLRVRANLSDDGTCRNSNIAKLTTLDKYTMKTALPVPYGWLEANLDCSTDAADEAAHETVAAARGANDVPNEINYALLARPADETDRFLTGISDVDAAAVTSEPESLLTLFVPGDRVTRLARVDGGVTGTVTKTVAHALQTAAARTATFEASGDEQDGTNFVRNANAADQTFWHGRVRVTTAFMPKEIYAFEETYTSSCDSANTVGLTRVTSDRAWTALAVAYDAVAWNARSIAVADAIGTRNLTPGDELWTWDAAAKAYRVFQLTADRTWDALPLKVDGTDVPEQAAADCRLSRGYGFWLKRANVASVVHVYGQVPYATAPAAEVKLADGNTLIGAPTYAPLKFARNGTEADALAVQLTANAGDGDLIHLGGKDDYFRIFVYRKKLKAWYRLENGTPVYDFTVPIGQAFWYSRNTGEAFSFNWDGERNAGK